MTDWDGNETNRVRAECPEDFLKPGEKIVFECPVKQRRNIFHHAVRAVLLIAVSMFIKDFTYLPLLISYAMFAGSVICTVRFFRALEMSDQTLYITNFRVVLLGFGYAQLLTSEHITGVELIRNDDGSADLWFHAAYYHWHDKRPDFTRRIMIASFDDAVKAAENAEKIIPKDAY